MFEDNIVPNMKDWGFVDKLSSYTKPVFSCRQPGANTKVSLRMAFDDKDGLLETALFSLRRLLTDADYLLADDGYVVSLQSHSTEYHEAYSISTSANKVVLESADTEGMRRAIYELEDMILAADGHLPPEGIRISRKPFLKTRISRCPFSPIKRWPVNTDELLDDIDYYPDEYLETLAHEGVNAIWIVTALRELGITALCPPDPQREKRIAKLSKVARKTIRYGIRLFLFMIEPFSAADDDPLVKKYPEMFGPTTYNNRHSFCPCSVHTRQYLHELLSSVFAAVPELGGVIDINIGERPTSCLSTQPLVTNSPRPCQDRCGQSFGNIMRTLLTTMNDAIHAGAPDAKLVAWFYMPQVMPHASWVQELSKYPPKDVIVQANFESGGEKYQLGRRHLGVDYWVSYDGPAAPYVTLAKNRGDGELGAKLQLGCGHELTPVACIPAPSIAYRKYRSMHELGVGHVMQSWYVGNFPDVMSRAMGKLAFEDFANESEEAFLERLARPYWREDAPIVAKAWKLFDEAYQNFPFNVIFQYFGPQNSMPRWKFHFLPDLEPLAPPWKPNFPFGGDAIGEALAGFSIEECLELLESMVVDWNRGLELLMPLREKMADNNERLLEIGTADCIGCLLEGTLNLLKFFRLRRDYIAGNRTALTDMRQLVLQQMELYRRMIPLVSADSRLGFHGEALTHLFSVETIQQALEDAETSLALADELEKDPRTPFEQALAHGSFRIVEPGVLFESKSNSEGASSPIHWKYDIKGDDLVISVKYDWADSRTLLHLYFIDLTGTESDRLESFSVTTDTIEYQGSSEDTVTGIPRKLVSSAVKTGDTVAISYPLALLPRGLKNCPYIRFNLLIGNNYANGKGWPGRLYKGSFNPHEALCLRLIP
ncbi:MAG: hypothetical protein J6X55_17370 [Victivallales bacterium]|nr:hypothetical protein [Victivallales bacterium]